VIDRPESAFDRHHGQQQCPSCHTWVQWTPAGTLADGMAAHLLRVHPGKETSR
jgi:hypothetical protein